MNGLHRCASAGNLERVKELVKGGANIEELDQDGETALLLACYEGHHDIVVYLVEHGANVAHTTTEGTTTLHSACALAGGLGI
jgi:ankyrin repeat protein